MDALTLSLIFAALFVAQTAIYTLLLLRMRKRTLRPQPPPVIPPTSHRITPVEELPRSVVEALRLLREGPLSAREVSLRLGLSREHTARLLKRMVEEGLVAREGKPYRYRLTDSGERLLKTL